MAVTLTKEFSNLVLFLFACLALGLSIWALSTPCKKDKFVNSNTNLICDFTLRNPIQINYESGSCSTNDVDSVQKYVKKHFGGLDIVENGCYKGSNYQLQLSDNEAKKLCNHIIN